MKIKQVKVIYSDKATKFDEISIFVLTRDVTTGATGATAVAPKFSDTLTLSQPRGADSTDHCRGRS